MNGWTNRETWLVNLWFNPETKSDIDYLEETLEDDFLNMCEKHFGTSANIYVDMIDFNCINWDELREAQEDEELYDCGCINHGNDENVGCESCAYISCLDCHHINSQSANSKEWICYEGYGCNKGDKKEE